MKLAFSTLGCPNWGLQEIAEAAHQFGYASIELRALKGSINLLEQPDLQPVTIERTSAFLRKRGLSVCCVDTSCSFDAIDEGIRKENIEIALRHAALAVSLDAPLIRVFPNEVPAGATRKETRDRIAAALRQVAAGAPEGVRIGLETHGDFATGTAAAEIVRLADHPKLVVIWDAANSFAAGEPINMTVRAVFPYLAHVHLRDARPDNGQSTWRPVLAGRGLVPFKEVTRALQGMTYAGYICFEWEKHWHPEIEEPEIALPDFASAMSHILSVNGASMTRMESMKSEA